MAFPYEEDSQREVAISLQLDKRCDGHAPVRVQSLPRAHLAARHACVSSRPASTTHTCVLGRSMLHCVRSPLWSCLGARGTLTITSNDLISEDNKARGNSSIPQPAACVACELGYSEEALGSAACPRSMIRIGFVRARAGQALPYV